MYNFTFWLETRAQCTSVSFDYMLENNVLLYLLVTARAQRHNPTFWLQARAQTHNCTFWLQARAQKHNSTFWFQLQTQKLHLLVAGANTATVPFVTGTSTKAVLYLLVTGANTTTVYNYSYWLQAGTQQLYTTIAFGYRREHIYCTQLYLLVTGASTDEAGFAHSIVPHQNTLDEFLNKNNQFLVIYSFRGFLKSTKQLTENVSSRSTEQLKREKR